MKFSSLIFFLLSILTLSTQTIVLGQQITEDEVPDDAVRSILNQPVFKDQKIRSVGVRSTTRRNRLWDKEVVVEVANGARYAIPVMMSPDSSRLDSGQPQRLDSQHRGTWPTREVPLLSQVNIREIMNAFEAKTHKSVQSISIEGAKSGTAHDYTAIVFADDKTTYEIPIWMLDGLSIDRMGQPKHVIKTIPQPLINKLLAEEAPTRSRTKRTVLTDEQFEGMRTAAELHFSKMNEFYVRNKNLEETLAVKYPGSRYGKLFIGHWKPVRSNYGNGTGMDIETLVFMPILNESGEVIVYQITILNFIKVQDPTDRRRKVYELYSYSGLNLFLTSNELTTRTFKYFPENKYPDLDLSPIDLNSICARSAFGG